MARVYIIPTETAWDSSITFFNFIVAAFMLGYSVGHSGADDQRRGPDLDCRILRQDEFLHELHLVRHVN